MALILTLRDGGARLVSTGNLNTTQPEAVQVLKAVPDRINAAVAISYLDRKYPGRTGGVAHQGSWWPCLA